MKTYEPGLHEIPKDEYHALPMLSSGLIRALLAQSPLHAWHSSRLNPDYVEVEKQEFDLGTAAHAYLLEGGKGIEVIDPAHYPTDKGTTPKGWTTNAMKAARDAAYEAGKTPLLPAQLLEVQKMAGIARQAILDCEDLGGITLADGIAEPVLIWQEEGGAWCKVRPDWMSHDRRLQISYKTTGSNASPFGFERMIDSMGYDTQEAFYLRGNRHTGGPVDCKGVTLVQENVPPYACSWMGLDPMFADLAETKVSTAIEVWSACLKSGKWPGYGNRIAWISPPTWMMARWEEKTIHGFRRPEIDPVQTEHGLQI